MVIGGTIIEGTIGYHTFVVVYHNSLIVNRLIFYLYYY